MHRTHTRTRTRAYTRITRAIVQRRRRAVRYVAAEARPGAPRRVDLAGAHRRRRRAAATAAAAVHVVHSVVRAGDGPSARACPVATASDIGGRESPSY